MARVQLSVKELTERNKFLDCGTTAAMATAVDATDGAEFVMKERDDKYLIVVTNAASAAKTVTLKAGDGFQAGEDLVHSVPASSFSIISIDSGRYKKLSGEDKGKVLIVGESADIKVAVFRLP